MSEQAKDRHSLLMMVIDIIGEEIEKGEPCQVCLSVVEKLRKLALQENEKIVESLRADYGIV